MADSAITDYTSMTAPHLNILFETVDLRESAAADQNKKITLSTIMSKLVCHNNEVVCHDDEVVYLSA